MHAEDSSPTASGRPRTDARRFDWRITLLVAAAAFGTESVLNFYDAQVPPLLKEYVGSAAVIGLLMGMDNILGIFIQPWIGNRSDHTRTRWGRRMPYLMVGMPVAAVLFALIPFAGSLPMLLLVMFLFALVTNSFKPIAESLMPDYVGPRFRSRGNAVVKIAVSLTIIVSALVSVFVIDAYPRLAFSIPAALMLLAVGLLIWRVRDSESPAYQEAVANALDPQAGDGLPAARVRDIVRDIVRDADKSRVLVLVAIFLFAGGWAASRSLLTNYGIESLHLTRGQAGGLALPAGIAFIVAAFPIALLSERFGRIRAIKAGAVLFLAALVLGTVVPTTAGTMITICLVGVGFAAFSINGVVVLWNLAPTDLLTGTYTGLFTIGYATGSALGPALVGALVDITGWRFFFLDVAVLVLASLAVLQLKTARYGDGQLGRNA